MLDARHLFPDQSHINQVRDALWGNYGNGASVMIGSGFSKSALKVRPGIGDPPMLTDIAAELHRRLYPDTTDSNQQIETSSTAADHILSLAQEYVTAFERANLHELLQRLIRDDDLMPGNTHARLLRLPWRDVFTTNWDTLLERALPQVTDRPYTIVRDRDEIPLAKKPRIVKLHGSLPAQFPLILTEEDYRTYPQEFAPFVNTVQQAMMETVFCLIGFSGNDPNFLNWSGWVRDNLGTSAPRIYLVGWLNLPHHRRRMLEHRGVVAVDLAHHPMAHIWPEHQRYQYAIDWVLHTLERGRPYDLTYWPTPTGDPDLNVPHLEPVAQKTSSQPLPEPSASQTIDDTERTDRVMEILDIWKHNRQLYPGWLFLPASEQRELFQRCTDSWEQHILAVVSTLPTIQRLKAIYELAWRRKILLEPFSNALESAAADVLPLVNCDNRTIEGVTDPRVDWVAIREMWRDVALALVTTARLDFDDGLFDHRTVLLEPFVGDHPDVYHHLHQDHCLKAMYTMDFDALGHLLEDWVTRDCDPIWMVRKAALLSELNRNDEARQLVEEALSEIRAIADREGSVAGASREAWAMWSAFTIKRRFEFQKRWDELATLQCDAMFERDFIARHMTPDRDSSDAPAFDLGRRQAQGVRFSSFRPDLAAFRGILLSEVAGLAPVTRYESPIGHAIASDILRSASEALATSHPELAIRLVLRASHSETDKALNRVLSRTKVAALSESVAEDVSNSCINVINYALPRLTSGGKPQDSLFWVTRMRVALEVLSRLALRASPDQADKLLEIGLQCYKSPEVTQQLWLYTVLEHLLQRAWEALPMDRRIDRALILMGSPIVGMDSFRASVPGHLLDPAELLNIDCLPDTRRAEHDGSWQEVIAFLLRALVGDAESRRRASRRILLLSDKGLLTESESSATAQAFWTDKYTGPDGLPVETHLLDWAFLQYPEPSPGVAEERFRLKWLSGDVSRFQSAPEANGNVVSISLGSSQVNPDHLENVLWNIGAGVSGLRYYGRPLHLTDSDREYITALVELWVTLGIPSYPLEFLGTFAQEPTRTALRGIASILHEDVISEPLAERLYEKAKRLTDSGIPAFNLAPGLVKMLPARFDDLANWLRMGMVSENYEISANAMAGFRSWLTASVDPATPLPRPPEDILNEVGLIIASRRNVSLANALQLAIWVFTEGTPAHQDAIGALAVNGLTYLAEELRYDRERDPAEDDDLPFLRLSCVQLAQSMAHSNFAHAPAVANWLSLGKDDPLPEVRYAVTQAQSYTDEA